MRKILVASALAVAVSFGALQGAAAQSAMARFGTGSSVTPAQYARRGGRATADNGWKSDRPDDYLRGLRIDPARRARMEREWRSHRTREQRLSAIRGMLDRQQQRRFDRNRAELERNRPRDARRGDEHLDHRGGGYDRPDHRGAAHEGRGANEHDRG